MTVYIETIFLDNFLLDTFLLWLAARFLCKTPFRRILLGGVFGGIYACAAAFLPLLTALPIKLLTGMLLCFISFRRSFLRGTLYFFVLSFLFSGIMLLLEYSNAAPAPKESLSPHGRILLTALFAVICLTAFLKRSDRSLSCPITVHAEFGSYTLIFPAEHDTGCTIKDHHGNGVILLDRTFAEREIPFYKELSFCPPCKTRFFTVSTIAGCSRLIGFKPLKTTIMTADQQFHADCWIIIADQINLNNCPAIYGKGLITEPEDKKCSHFSESIFSGFFQFCKKITVIISAAASRFRRRSAKRKNPPSC